VALSSQLQLPQCLLSHPAVFLPHISIRTAIKLLEQVAQKFQPPRCNLGDEQCAGVELPPPVDPQGTVLPQDLPDVRSYHVGLPESLPYRDFMKHEGSTYFW
jgi:hypothetical protein